jgi:hypothetical protein
MAVNRVGERGRHDLCSGPPSPTRSTEDLADAQTSVLVLNRRGARAFCSHNLRF